MTSTDPGKSLGTLIGKEQLTYNEDFLDAEGKPTIEMKVTIKGFVRGKVADPNGRESVKGQMTFEETDRRLTIGVEKMRPLPGRPMDHIGKKVTLYGDPSVKFGKKQVGGIRIRVGWGK